MELPKLTLANIGDGAAMERFEAEMAKVIANIMDPATAPDAKRTIKLEVVLKPHKDRREMIDVQIKSAAKLAAIDPAGADIRLARDPETGEVAALHHTWENLDMFSQAGENAAESVDPDTGEILEEKPDASGKVHQLKK